MKCGILIKTAKHSATFPHNSEFWHSLSASEQLLHLHHVQSTCHVISFGCWDRTFSIIWKHGPGQHQQEALCAVVVHQGKRGLFSNKYYTNAIFGFKLFIPETENPALLIHAYNSKILFTKRVHQLW